MASAKRASDGKVKDIRVAWKDVRTQNEWWVKQPEQQLSYAAARIWARRWTPGAMLGVYAREEFAQVQSEVFHGTTLDAQAEPVAAIPHDPAPAAEPKKQTVAQWLDSLEADLASCASAEGVDAVVARDDVQRAMSSLKADTRARLNAMVKAALERTSPSSDEDDDFPGQVTRDDSTAEVDGIVAGYGASTIMAG